MSQSNENGSFIGNETVMEVLKLLTSKQKNHLIFGVQAPPGSGKSTTLMKGVHENMTKIFNKEESKSYKPFRMFVVEPTVPATTGLYNYMNDKYGKKIKIGYSAERDVRYNKDTELVYCTGGHMENKIIALFKDGAAISDWDFCDVLVLDEADRGSLDYETIIALWLQADNMKKNVPRLILMSATLSMTDLGFKGFSLVEAEHTPFPVKVEYKEDRKYRIDDNELYRDTGKIVYERHSVTPIPEKGTITVEQTIVSDKKKKTTSTRQVDMPGYSVWIVFCPGKRELMSCANACKKLYEDNRGINMEIMMVYGGMGADGYKKIFEAPEEGTRRIIFCTNIIEASVTVPFADGVFDTCRAKYNVGTPSGANCLTLGYTSKSSARQRTGRTGRLCPGFCVRVISEEEFNKLDEQQVPEAMRVPLHNTIIKLKSVGLDPLKIFRDRISKLNVEIAMKALLSLEMIKVDEDGVESVTEMGYFSVLFPISVYASAMLYHWREKGYNMFMGIVVICLIDGFDEGYFYYPIDDSGSNMETANKEYFLDNFQDYEGKTQLETLIIMWHYIIYTFGTIQPKIYHLKKWCMKKSLNSKKIVECLSTIAAVAKICHRQRQKEKNSKFGEIVIEPFSKIKAIKNITPILVKVYGYRDSYLFDSRKKIYKYRRGEATLKMSNRNPMTTNTTDYMEIIPLRLKTTSVVNGRIGNTFITFFAPHSGNYLPDSDDINFDKKQEEEAGSEDYDTENEEEKVTLENNIRSSPNKSGRKKGRKKPIPPPDSDSEEKEKKLIKAVGRKKPIALSESESEEKPKKSLGRKKPIALSDPEEEEPKPRQSIGRKKPIAVATPKAKSRRDLTSSEDEDEIQISRVRFNTVPQVKKISPKRVVLSSSSESPVEVKPKTVTRKVILSSNSDSESPIVVIKTSKKK
jgi:HrpA-like RNA helicase